MQARASSIIPGWSLVWAAVFEAAAALRARRAAEGRDPETGASFFAPEVCIGNLDPCIGETQAT